MTKISRRLGRLFCCLLIAGCPTLIPPGFGGVGWGLPAPDATEPAKTLISESVFGKKSGADKKDAALNFVASALSIAEAVSQKEIVDEDKFRAGLGQIIDGTVACLNASSWAKAK